MMTAMIKVENLTHAYEKRTILDGVNLTVEAGERCALVGRNGAGKSTFIHILVNMIKVKQGSILIAGH